MKTIDFQEFLAHELQDPEVRREFIIGYFEQDGIAGVQAALEEIARVDEKNTLAMVLTSDKAAEEWEKLRIALHSIGLEFRLVPRNVV